jgi:hypothetical protein
MGIPPMLFRPSAYFSSITTDRISIKFRISIAFGLYTKKLSSEFDFGF